MRRAKHAAEFTLALDRIENDFRAFQEHPSHGQGKRVLAGMRELALRARTCGFGELDENARLFSERFHPHALTAEEVKDPALFELEGGLRIMEHAIAMAANQFASGGRLHGQGWTAAARVDDSGEVFVLGKEAECLNEVVGQLGAIGYRLRRFELLAHLAEALDTPLPLAVLVDQRIIERDMPGVQALHMSLAGAFSPVPIFSVCGGRDLESRLMAVRAGGAGYFPEPPAINELVDALESFAPRAESNPYRILLVDDDQEQAEYHAGVLEDHGMHARVVQDPFTLLTVMAEFGPDLVLMDLYMPGVSGEELGKVVRQDPVFASVPIVFFSEEKDLVKQLDAVSEAGDYFLSKNMLSDHMALAVKSRAARYRKFRAKMMRDGLTGLLNHTNLKLMLESEVRRAARTGGRFAFAMLDLDHFKRVNDTYGHPVGDMVLKAVSKVLTQRLRASDVLGRYGGEEFAAILVDAKDGRAAVAAMDQVREHFARVEHHGEGATFTVTLSCGVAMFPDFDTAASLAEAADKALYEAKQGGRNRVVLAGAPPCASGKDGGEGGFCIEDLVDSP
jgi:diguanylate cyclase (GGDEF)-like protein